MCRLVVVLKEKVFVYSLCAQPVKLLSFETANNDRGLVAISTNQGPNVTSAVLAIPGKTVGQVQLIEMTFNPAPLTTTTTPATLGVNLGAAPPATSTPGSQSLSPDSVSHQQTTSTITCTIVAAHESELACICLSSNGKYLATASVKGTLIRIFDTQNARKLQELRRGADNADIYSIQFNQSHDKLCVASDKGTIHVFNFNSEEASGQDTQESPQVSDDKSSNNQSQDTTQNRQSSLAFLAPFLPKYFSSEWSFAYAKLPVEVSCICGFVSQLILPPADATADDQKIKQDTSTQDAPPTDHLMVICSDGSVYRYSFNSETGGECSRESFNWFFKGF